MPEVADGVPAILQFARDKGTADVFAGKRLYARYNIGVSTELTTDPENPESSWSVVTHNISGGGVGLWSKERLPVGTAVHLRDITEKPTPAWIPGHVRHCSVGIRGYLLGIRFEAPVDTAEDRQPQSDESDAPHNQRQPDAPYTARQNPIIAQTRHIVGGATSALVAFIVSHQITGHLHPTGDFIVLAALSSLTGALVGYLFGCLYARVARRHVRVLRQMIRDLSEGRTAPPPPAMAATREWSVLYGSLRDLGSRLHLREEDKRIQRQKLEDITQVKSNILAIVSHDMRTPLTSILLYAQMLLDEDDAFDSSECKGFLEIIHGECTRLSRLVDDLLEVQRLESDRANWDIQSHDLTETVRSCVSVFEAMANSKDITLHIKCQPDLPPIEADADKLSQVLSNLVSNALKYTEPGGTVEVSAELHGSDFLLRVADSGPGIERDQWDQIFDRFMQIRDLNTSDIAGVGLGLYIVRKIVERHGGCIWVNSELGRGSEFVVSIPKSSPSRLSPGKLPAFAGRKVIVCDSDPELVAMVSLVLRHHGLEVQTAHSAKRLMAHLDHSHVDLVITDILLPDASGPELLEHLADVSRKNCRVIVHSYEGDAGTLGAKGIDVFLRRPASQEALIAAVRRALLKRSDEGHNIVTLQDGIIDIERLHALFVGRGHTPMLTETLPEAGQLLSEYAIDCVILPETSLDQEWSELGSPPFYTNGSPRVVVLCESVGQQQRELAGATGALAVTFRRGQELSLMELAVASEPPVQQECAV